MLAELLETEIDLHLVKQCALTPILLEMICRDLGKLKDLSDGIIFGYLACDLEKAEEMAIIQSQKIWDAMNDRGIAVLSVETQTSGVNITYIVKKRTQHLKIDRNMVRTEIFNLFGDYWHQLAMGKTGQFGGIGAW